MPMRPTLILASASPRRHDILDTIGLSHEIIVVPDPSGDDEPQRAGEASHAYVRRTAREKAMRTADHLMQLRDTPCRHGHGPYILSADTSVILNGSVLGKPQDAAHATDMLKQLSGQTHTVHTAVVLWHAGQLLETEAITEVSFARLSADDIRDYCATGEYQGKAGAYGIQGYAARFVSCLNGSYTGVVGLPAFETVELLRQGGYPV